MRTTRLLPSAAYATCALALSACVSYSPAEVSALSSYEICSAQVNQGSGITEASWRLLQSELERRKVDCRAHRAAIQFERDERLYYYMYGQQSP
jgi:ABC-type uncharacterized transport system auxiliary subunit